MKPLLPALAHIQASDSLSFLPRLLPFPILVEVGEVGEVAGNQNEFDDAIRWLWFWWKTLRDGKAPTFDQKTIQIRLRKARSGKSGCTGLFDSLSFALITPAGLGAAHLHRFGWGLRGLAAFSVVISPSLTLTPEVVLQKFQVNYLGCIMSKEGQENLIFTGHIEGKRDKERHSASYLTRFFEQVEQRT